MSATHKKTHEKLSTCTTTNPLAKYSRIIAIVFFLISGAKTGKDNGFSILFDIESYDYGYYDEGSEGLKVAVVHHLDMPIIRQVGTIRGLIRGPQLLEMKITSVFETNTQLRFGSLVLGSVLGPPYLAWHT